MNKPSPVTTAVQCLETVGFGDIVQCIVPAKASPIFSNGSR